MNIHTTSQNTIGVVVPVYNASRYIDACVESIAEQTHEDLRCVLIDDGSQDDSVARIKAVIGDDPRFLICRQANAGPGAARNAGYLALKQHWPDIERVTFFDADDIWHPHACETLRQLARQHPAQPGVYALGRDIDDEGQPLPGETRETWMRHRKYVGGRSIKKLGAEEPTCFAALAFAPCIVNGGVLLIRCDAFEQIGGFEDRLRGPEDWDMWIRLSRLGDLPMTDRVVLDYRLHGGGVSSDRGRTVKAVQTVRYRALNDPSNTSEQRRTARRAYRLFYLDMARMRFRDLIKHKNKQSLKLCSANAMMGFVGRPVIYIKEVAEQSSGSLGRTACPSCA